MPVIADIAVAMLMQVTADDQTHIGSIELGEQLRPNRWRNARRTHDIVGWVFEEERLVQEQGGGAPPGAQLLSSHWSCSCSRAKPEPKSCALTPSRRQPPASKAHRSTAKELSHLASRSASMIWSGS